MLKGRKKEALEDVLVKAPIKGKVVDIKEINDQVFNKEMLGKGVAIIPSEGKVFAPADGYVRALYPTNHALGLQLDSGEQVLIHIGLNTVKLEGNGFTAFTEKNKRFKEGDLLIEFDMGYIQGKGHDITTPVIITNSNEFESVDALDNLDSVEVMDSIIKVIK